MAIRFLHPTKNLDVIKEELNEKGFKVKNVHNARHPVTKSPLPLFFVDLEQNPINPEIFKLQKLVCTNIRVEEPYKRKEIPQCHRCQEVGHTKAYCHHEPRCVKCGKGHLFIYLFIDHGDNYKNCYYTKQILNSRVRQAPSKPTDLCPVPSRTSS